jgi:hypothetical protein
MSSFEDIKPGILNVKNAIYTASASDPCLIDSSILELVSKVRQW